MAKIPSFDARAPRKGLVSGYADDGSSQAWASLSSAAGQISARLGAMADKAVVREQTDAAKRDGSQISMPSVNFAFGGKPVGQKMAPGTGEVENYIRAAAEKRGIDPDTAVRVARSEGLAEGVWQSNVVKNGKRERSYGPFQLYIDGGLGNEFERKTGKSAADPSTVNEQIDFALDKAIELGWSPWFGAAKVGIGARDGLPARGAAASPVAPASAPVTTQQPGGGVSVTITGGVGPMPQKPGGTLAGDAYNQAARKIFMNRLDTSMRASIDALEIQHGDNPAELDTALAAMRAGFVADLPPDASAEFDMAFEAQRVGAIGAAAKRAQADFESNLLASYEDKIAAHRDTAIRLATNAGADPAQDELIARELAAIGADIDQSPMTPLAKARMRRELEQDVLKARVLGSFDAQEGPDARAAYLERFQAEWKGGEGFGGRVGADEYERINSEMITAINRDRAAAEKRAREIDKAIGAQIDYLEKGLPVPADVRASMGQAVAQSGDEGLAARMDFFDRLADWQKAHIGARPEVLDAQIDALNLRIAQEGITPAAATTLGVMQGLKKQMAIGLKVDPLGWATRAGVASVSPIDASSPEALTASLAGRAAEAEAVAGHYGVRPVYFRPAERDALIKAAENDPLMLPQIAGSMIGAFGADTPAVLSELSTDAPVLAHIADLQHRTGNEGLTVEAAEALAMRKAEGYKSALPTPAKLQAAALPSAGPALGHAPRAMNAMVETATALFEYRAQRRGIDPANVHEAGDPAHDLFLEALDQAAGGRMIGGVKHGGFAAVNGRMTIAPEDMPADNLERLVSRLVDSDLVFQQEIVSANGVAIGAREIANGMLIYAGPGRYHVALGDIEGGDPRFVGTRGGRRWTLDINMLRTTRHDR